MAVVVFFVENIVVHRLDLFFVLTDDRYSQFEQR